MSGSLGDLTVRFTGDASQLAATISGVQGQLAGMQGGFKGASSASDSFISGTKKGASVLSTYQRQMYAVGETVKQYENKLSKAKTVVSDSERALSKATATYEKNKKSVFENCSVLKQQEKALGVSIQAKEHEIGEYQKINALIDKNSSEYKDNVKYINQATKEIGGLERQQRSVQNSLAAQGRIMQSNINDYNNAKAAVDNANKSYQSTSEALKQAQSAYKEYESGLAAVEKQQRLLDMQATGKNLKEIGSGVDTVTKPIQIASAALAAGGVASAKFAVDFEDNFANVKKTVEGTPQQLEKVKQGIIDLTTTGINGRNAIPQTTAQLTELAAAGGQLGIETPNILEFTETMAQMGTATNLYGAEGAATLARFMNVTNTSQDQVKNLGSAIVDLGNNFATTESEIAILGLRMGATGNVVGISAQDILGYSTALSSMGIEAEAGGSAVSRIWMDIQSAVSSGGEELQTFAKVSGKSSTEFADQWKTDASGAFQEFLVGLSKSEDQVQTLAELGFNNIRDIQALQRLASEKGIQLVTEALQRANTAWSENIALQKEADAKAETTAGQIQIMKNNLTEAARSIGETFLPMIVKGSTSVKEFAQGIADMSDEGKQRLINLGESIIVLGAGSKAIAGATKSIGSIIEAIGKLRTISATINAATEGVGALSAASSTFTAVAPAFATALGWLAVPASMYVGMELWAAHLKKAEQEFLHIGDGAGEFAKTAAATISAANTANEYAEKLREVNDTISKGSDGTPEGNSAYNQAIEQRKEYVQWFIDNYGDYVAALESGNEVTNNTAAIIQQMTAAEKEAKMSELNFKVNEGGYNVGGLQESIKTYEKQNEAIYKNNAALYNLKKGLTDLNTEYSSLNNQIDNKSISKGEYVDKIDELEEKYKGVAEAYHELTGDDFNWANADMVEDALAAIDNRLSENSEKVEENKKNIEAAKASVNEYQEAARVASDVMLAELPAAIENGNGKTQEYIAKIGEYGKAVGFSFNEMGGYANQAALKLNGFNSVTEAVADKNGGLNASVRDCVNTMQQWGYSASQAAVQGALLQNGFSDIISAAKTEGGLDTIIQQANQLAHSMGLVPENKTIKISAEGDISLIDDTTQNIEEINGKNVTVGVQVNGKDEIVAVTELVKNFGMETAVAILMAQDNASIIVDGVSYKIQGIDKTTGKARVEAEDGATLVLDLVTGKLYNLDGTEVTSSLKANDEATPVAEDVTDAIHDIPTSHNTYITASDNASGTANRVAAAIRGIPSSKTITINTVVSGGLPSPNALANGITAKGTSDAKAGFGIINDEKGVADPTELLIRDGVGYTFEGRDVPIMFKKHDVLLTASQTKDALASLPHYASGKNNEAWETAKSDREHIRKTTYSIIPAWEELEWLDEMKQKFASDAEVIKEIEEEIVTYTKQVWQDSLDTMQYSLDMGWISQEEYYSKLAVYRDENFAPDTEEYRDATLELHKHSVQLIEDANEASKAYIDLHGSLNDWNEMGTGMGEVWQTINRRNVQAANDGLITWEDYFDTRSEYTEQFLDNYIAYSDAWIDREKEYNNISADDAIAAIDRQRAEVRDYFAELGELTDEEYAYKVKVELELEQNRYDEVRNQLGSWEDDWQWQEKRAEVYGWENIGEDKLDFYQRVADKYTAWSENPELDPTKQQYARRQADEAQMELYKATEDYYDDILSEAKDRMDEVEKLLDDKLSALEESWEVEDRAEDKSETLADIEKYKNAVTIEGKEKYQEALDKLKEIEREEEKYQLELENNAIMEQMQSDYEALEAEKEKILQQTRDANAKIATLVEPLKASITDKTQALIDTIKEEIGKIKPSVTVTQTNNINVADKTDAILYSNNVFNKFVEAVGG